jgi:titin
MSGASHPHLDTLEPRLCLTTYTVNNALDAGAGSLRQAILNANAHTGADVIDFNIPIAGVKTLTPASLLPIITDPVTIDGTTQPGYSIGRPVVELRGSTLGGFGDHALQLTGGNSTVRGLIFTQWGGGFLQDTLWLHNGDNNVVEGCWFGIDSATGTTASANGNNIVLSNSSNNRIGGTTPQTRNVISGAGNIGILVGDNSDSNTIQGNYIGTNAAGTDDVGNYIGVYVESANNTIGGLAFGERNVISGNRRGVHILDDDFRVGAAGNRVQGNYIGTDVSGTRALGNTESGVLLTSGAHDNLIGGLTPEARNVIAANGIGVHIARNPPSFATVNAARDNAVQGNYIGLDVNGRPLGNTSDGVRISNASGNAIGSTIAAARNIIAANGAHGVLIETTNVTLPDLSSVSGTATANLVQGNYIGLRPDGINDEGNALSGVEITGAATANTIGGAAPGAGNVVSGNNGSGVHIVSAPSNVVQGNLIGLDAAGALAVPNADSGVSTTALNTLIAGNVVSGNDLLGIILGVTSDGSRVLGNRVGTDISGLLARPNGSHGVVAGGNRSTIGGLTPADRNLISGNSTFSGLFIIGNQNTVQGNYIGTTLTGDAALPNAFGVYIQGGRNTIGGSAPGAGNLVSGNTEVGIQFATTNANDNVIAGNLIGTDLTGNAALPNLDDGIHLSVGARNQIGGVTPAEANVISANRGYGVRIDSNASDNRVQGNLIGVARVANSPLGNFLAGVGIGSSAASPSNNNNLVGGSEVGAGNTIAYNGGAGVEVRVGTGNAIYGNHLFANALMPIDLAADGPPSTTTSTPTPAPTTARTTR